MSNAITVQAATTSLAPVQFSLDAPSLFDSATSTIFGQVHESHNVDVPAPLFELSQPNAEFELVSGNFGAKINPDTTFSDGAIELLAMNQEGSAGVLPPNYTGEYDIRFTAINDLPHTSLDITFSVTDPSTSLDLSLWFSPAPTA